MKYMSEEMKEKNCSGEINRENEQKGRAKSERYDEENNFQEEIMEV